MPTASQATSIPRSSLGLLALLTLFWGLNWPFMKVVITEWPIWSFRALCVIAGTLGLFGIARVTGQSLRVPPGQWGRLIVIALLNITIWNVLALYGLTLLPSGRAAILAFTMPLWGVILGYFLLGEPLHMRRLLGLLLGLGGLSLLISGELQALKAAPVGAICMLGAAVSWALGTVLLKRYPVALSITAFAGWQMLIGGLPLIIGALILDRGRFDHGFTMWPILGLFYNMIICFIFCYWAWFRIVSLVPVGISALSTLMIPCVGVLSGMAVLGEKPAWNEFAALALIIMALATVLLPSRQPPPGPAV